MKLMVTGGLGFTGAGLTNRLLDKGHEVTVISRAPAPGAGMPESIRYVPGDIMKPGPWQEEVAAQDGVFNLVGATVARRWTAEVKKLLYDSRVLSTRHVVAAMSKDTFLCNASAIGYYGFGEDRPFKEDDPPGHDFLAGLCVDWEKEAMKGKEKNIRVVTARIGVVLGKNGGALKQMLPAFQSFAGGPIGSGRQWFSWIHMEDLLGAYLHVLEHRDMRGPVNFSGPIPVRNQALAKTLGKILGRPSFLSAPAFMIRLRFGEFGDYLLKGQRVAPAGLLEHGFIFRFPDLEPALRDLL